MDNNNNSQRPRKKVTKEVLRRRQLTALAVIAIVVLIFVILIANACTDKSGRGSKKDSTTSTTSTTTTTTTTTEMFTEPPTTTTTAPMIDPNLSAMVQLSTRELTLAVGENDMPVIYVYPDGSTATNEVWTSSDPNIATVDYQGDVIGVNPGECNIILTFDNNPAIEVQIKVTVTGSVQTPEVPETPVDVQPDVNTPEVPENPEYQNPETPNDPSNLYANSQGALDTQNIVIPEQSADTPNPDESQT